MNARSENVIGGIVGAFLGSLIGVVCIVIFGQIGLVSAISGVVMGVCALKGYELLGGKLSTKGIIISVFVMVIMVYAGNRLNWAITLQKEIYTEETVFSVFKQMDLALEQLKSYGADTSGYGTDLAMQYGFSALGAISSIVTALKKTKQTAAARQAQAQNIQDPYQNQQFYGSQNSYQNQPYGSQNQSFGSQPSYNPYQSADTQGDLGLGDEINYGDTFDL